LAKVPGGMPRYRLTSSCVSSAEMMPDPMCSSPTVDELRVDAVARRLRPGIGTDPWCSSVASAAVRGEVVPVSWAGMGAPRFGDDSLSKPFRTPRLREEVSEPDRVAELS
jgi:hypothetical protein